MILSKKSIKSINYQKSAVIVKLNLTNKIETHNIDDINKIFIKFKKTKDFYFFDYTSLALLMVVLFSWEKNFYNSFYIVILFLCCWTFYLIRNRVYYVRIKLKNVESYKYYFSKSIKYEIIEKVKTIRGQILFSNFNMKAK